MKIKLHSDGSTTVNHMTFKRPEIAAKVIANKLELQAAVDKAGNDPKARKAALLAAFGIESEQPES